MDNKDQYLEARLRDLGKAVKAQSEAAAAEISRLAAENQRLDAERARLTARVTEMDAELLAREHRLKALKKSLSWRMTAPLRDLEHLFRRNGRAAVPEIPRDPPAPPVLAPHSPAAAPAPARGYTYNLDHPRRWSTAAERIQILGWCFDNSARPITGVRARYGGNTFVGSYGSKRLDVLASTLRPQAELSGLKVEVRTVRGDHPLALEVEQEDGWHPIFETLVHGGDSGDPAELSDYERWCAQHETLEGPDRAAIWDHIAAFADRPLISILMPVFNPAQDQLEKAIESVVQQLYPRWELCVADDASTEGPVRATLERFAARDARIKVVLRRENGHICAATNTALETATGEFVALLDHDDVLAPTALYEVAAEINAHPSAQFIYSDEDKIDLEDRRFDPYFKPDWNPALGVGQNYTSHLSVYRTALVRQVGGFRPGFEGSQDWDLTLRVVERVPAAAIRHVPKVLYHWRAAPGSTALQTGEKSYPREAARKAVSEHFRRRGLTVEVLPAPGDNWQVRHPVPAPAPLVSLVIPTRNQLPLLRQAVQSILAKTDYPHFEIIVVDNESDEPATLDYLAGIARGGNPRLKVLRFPGPFNYSAINNAAVRASAAEVVGLINSDVEVISGDWLSEMVSYAVQPGIGAVGAMLYYPNNTIQHAGVVLGLGGVAGHPYKEFPRGSPGQKNRLRVAQEVSAVTGACLLVRRDRYLEVGGLNEAELAVAFNDVDFCCKLIRAGYRNIWTPHAELFHHESATRGVEDTPERRARFQSEVDFMMNTYGDLLMTDPAYNPNLTLVAEDFSPAYLSRARKTWSRYLQ